MTKAPATNLRINADRLWNSMMETAAIGGTAAGGIRRLALSDEDRIIRDWFAGECRALGCTIAVDEVGNMFATRPGRRADALPIAIGSHLDTQPTGGKFDGVLGVLGAIEVLRTLIECDFTTDHPITIVNWTNEEGARFAPAMLGSGVYAGIFTRDFAESRRDGDGVSFTEAIERIGYRGPVKPGGVPLAALIELHIEQGPILEAERREVGIVEGVQAMRWYEITTIGRDSHAGSTPMELRDDALLAAIRTISGLPALARQFAPGVATVGYMDVQPNSRNVIPGRVTYCVDLRHPDDAILDRMEAALRQTIAAELASGKASLTEIWRSPAVRFDTGCLAAIEQSATEQGYSTRRMTSGAGHDAAHVAPIVPTAMIFVPSKDGLSHNEAEFTSKAQCVAGVQVLLGAVLNLDRSIPVPGAAR